MGVAHQEVDNDGEDSECSSEAGPLNLLEAGPSDRPAYAQRLVFRNRGRFELLPVETVEWLETRDGYVVLHTEVESKRFRVGLRALCDQLDPDRFVQIHRSRIVNASRVRAVELSLNGGMVACLRGGARLPVGSSRSSVVRAALLGRPESFVTASAWTTGDGGRWRLALRAAGRVELLQLHDLVYVRSEHNHCHVYTGAGSIRVRIALRDLAELLPRDRFLRVHRSTMVQMQHVLGVERVSSGLRAVLLSGGISLPIGRRFGSAFSSLLGERG